MWGLPREELEEHEPFEVWPENWDPLLAFRDCSTQWLRGPFGDPVGLRYEGVEAVLRLRGTEPSKDLFADLRTLELAALEVWRERAQARGDRQR